MPLQTQLPPTMGSSSSRSNSPLPTSAGSQQATPVMQGGGGFYEGSKSSIPELTTISPAIFVPIEGDELTAPFTPPANRIRRIEAKITKLDAHRKKIRHNLTALYRQECLRHIQNTQAWEREYPEKARQTLEEAARYKPETQRGIDLMIENMTIGLAGNSEHTRSRQEHQQNQNQNQNQQQQQQQQQQAGVKPRKDVDWYSRQQLVVNLEGTIGQGLKDLRAYEAHADALRKNYIEICNRERAKDRELDFP